MSEKKENNSSQTTSDQCSSARKAAETMAVNGKKFGRKGIEKKKG